MSTLPTLYQGRVRGTCAIPHTRANLCRSALFLGQAEESPWDLECSQLVLETSSLVPMTENYSCTSLEAPDPQWKAVALSELEGDLWPEN